MTRKIINLALSYTPSKIAQPINFIKDLDNLRKHGGYTRQDWYRAGQSHWHIDTVRRIANIKFRRNWLRKSYIMAKRYYYAKPDFDEWRTGKWKAYMKPKDQIKNGYRIRSKGELYEWIHQNYYNKFLDPETRKWKHLYIEERKKVEKEKKEHIIEKERKEAINIKIRF